MLQKSSLSSKSSSSPINRRSSTREQDENTGIKSITSAIQRTRTKPCIKDIDKSELNPAPGAFAERKSSMIDEESGYRSPPRRDYTSGKTRTKKGEGCIVPRFDSLVRYIDSFNKSKQGVILKEPYLSIVNCEEIRPDDIIDYLFDPKTVWCFSTNRQDLDHTTFDHAYVDSNCRTEFLNRCIPEEHHESIDDLELMDLMWVINWFKPQDKNVEKRVRRVYNSSDKGLKKQFGIDNRVACVVSYLTGLPATDYLQFMAPKNSNLHDKLHTGLYLTLRYVYPKDLEEDGLILTAPSFEIRASTKPQRNNLLNVNVDNYGAKQIATKLKLSDPNKAQRLAEGSVHDKLLFIDMIYNE